MRFHFSTVVWGDWHTGIFLDVNLPSLMAPGNLPAFCALHDVTYRIFTSRKDVNRIKSSAAFQAAAKLVKFEIVEAPVERAEDPIAMHHALWRRSIREAREAGVMVLFVPPDVAWSDGAFRHIAELVQQGKRAVFITYMRVVSETTVPELRARFLRDDGTLLRASSSELVEIMHRHIHPLTLTYLNDSDNFPVHPEFILWRVPGQGYLMRVLVREMFCYDPSMFDLNEQALPAHPLNPALVHFITDSDNLFSLSFAPALKDLSWYVERQRLSALRLGSWWLRYDSPANDQVAALYFRVHEQAIDAPAWRRAEIESDALVAGCVGTRELLRFLSALPTDRHTYLSQTLAALLSTSRIIKALSIKGPATIFVPHDEAVLKFLAENGGALLSAPGRRELIGLVRSHIILGRIKLQRGRSQRLETVGGGWRNLTWRGDVPLLDGIPFAPNGLPLGRHWGFLMNDLLPARSGQALVPIIPTESGRANHLHG